MATRRRVSEIMEMIKMRKLTEKQKFDKIIKKVTARVKNMEKDYAVDYVKVACRRYAEDARMKNKLACEIAEKEKELAELRKKHR